MKQTPSYTLLLATLLAASLSAQDDPPAAQAGGVQKKAIIVASSQDGDGPQAIQIQSVEIGGDPENSFIDSGVFSFSTGDLGSGAAIRMATPMGMGNPAMMNLLQNKSIRDEIELVDDQYKKIQDFYKARQASIMKEVQSMINPALSGDGKKSNRSVQLRGNKIKEMIAKQQEESEEKLKDLLLPHQLKRLQQVSHQVRMKNSGALNALTQGKLKEELGLTEEDVDNLKEKSKSIQKKLEEDIAKLRAKAKEKLLGELSAKQKRKLEELMGDEFEYKQTDWRERLKEIESRMKKKSEDKK